MSPSKRELLAEKAKANQSTANRSFDTQPEYVLVSQIDVFEGQPREYINPEKLAELQENIDQNGLLDPLLVVSMGKRDGREYFLLIAGHMRLQAVKNLGYQQVWVMRYTRLVPPSNPEDTEAMRDFFARAYFLAHEENDKRQNLSKIETVTTIFKLNTLYKISFEDLEQKFHLKKSQIYSCLTIAKRKAQIETALIEFGVRIHEVESIRDLLRLAKAVDSDDRAFISEYASYIVTKRKPAEDSAEVIQLPNSPDMSSLPKKPKPREDRGGQTKDRMPLGSGVMLDMKGMDIGFVFKKVKKDALKEAFSRSIRTWGEQVTYYDDPGFVFRVESKLKKFLAQEYKEYCKTMKS